MQRLFLSKSFVYGYCLMPIYFFSTTRNESNNTHNTGNRNNIRIDRCERTEQCRLTTDTLPKCRNKHNSTQTFRTRQPDESTCSPRHNVANTSCQSGKQAIQENCSRNNKGLHGVARLRTTRQAGMQDVIGRRCYNYQKQVPIARRKRQRIVFHTADVIYRHSQHNMDYRRFSRVHKQADRGSDNEKHEVS